MTSNVILITWFSLSLLSACLIPLRNDSRSGLPVIVEKSLGYPRSSKLSISKLSTRSLISPSNSSRFLGSIFGGLKSRESN